MEALRRDRLSTGCSRSKSSTTNSVQGRPRSVAIDGHRSLISCWTSCAGTRRRAAPAAPLPPRSPVEAIEFIEFAIDETAPPGFERCLGLGFAAAGMHQSKAVTRWRQGDISIVVNTREGGIRPLLQHQPRGVGLCARRFKVETPATRRARAKALLDQPFRQAVGPGELDIPRCAGWAAASLYFLDGKTELGRWWDIDFVPTGTSQRGAGLIRSTTSRRPCSTRRC